MLLYEGRALIKCTTIVVDTGSKLFLFISNHIWRFLFCPFSFILYSSYSFVAETEEWFGSVIPHAEEYLNFTLFLNFISPNWAICAMFEIPHDVDQGTQTHSWCMKYKYPIISNGDSRGLWFG